MPKKLTSLDSLDVRILEALGSLGPRNIKRVAETLGIPVDTLRRRIKRMSSLFYLRMSATVYHTYLGLKKAVVFAEATLGFEDLLFDCLKVNNFYFYLTRCYGRFEGCLACYVIPPDHCDEFIKFVEEIEKLGVARRIRVLWSTCFETVNPSSLWFDFKSEKWTFQWDEWEKEIPIEETRLPYTLLDPDGFPMRADQFDLLILPWLEVDATNDLTKIAEILRTTPQNIRYHYQKHIIERGLIEKYQIFVFPFDRRTSAMFWYTFKFDNEEKMARFASSLLDKPFMNIIGKILGENALVAQIYLPMEEFRNFTDSLSKLCRNGLLQSYEYVIQDLRKGKWSRETIPFEDSKDGKWIYDHKKHIETLRNLVKGKY
jgi:DNA-binding Lrp family transcriptional regulator